MLLNYNFFADTIENIVYPLIWRDSVADTTARDVLPNPVDGETRYVISEEDWYQYQKRDFSWHSISKITSGTSDNLTIAEEPTKIDSTTFETDNNFLSASLLVFINGIKEKNFTVTALDRFQLDEAVELDDEISCYYMKS